MSEKIAVHTPTKESYDRLMKAYEKKGWKKMYRNYINKEFPIYVSFQDGYYHNTYLETGFIKITVEEALARLGQYERGQEVLVRDNEDDSREKSIYLTTVEGAKYQYVTVDFGDEELFRGGKEFTLNAFKYIKPLEEPIKEMTMQEVETALGYKFKLIK